MSDETQAVVRCRRRINGAWEMRLNGHLIMLFDGWFERINRANAINLASKIGCAIQARIEIED